MKIRQVRARYYPGLQFGGPLQKSHDLSRGLRQCGQRVQPVILHSTRRAAAQADRDGIQIRSLPWVGKGTWQAPLGWGVLGDMGWAAGKPFLQVYDRLLGGADERQ